jgi:hypothetical protein
MRFGIASNHSLRTLSTLGEYERGMKLPEADKLARIAE